MTAVFVDTSALYAVLDSSDRNHRSARGQWARLLTEQFSLVTSNYVLAEACALVQHRLGVAAVRTLLDDVLPVLEIHWIGAAIHAQASASLLAAGRRKLSLVDCSSFAVMREAGIERAFAFDARFTEQGFRGVS